MSNLIKKDTIIQQRKVKTKTKKQRDKERKIVLRWALNNISQGEPNYYYFAVDVYDKFISDTKAPITQRSFGNYIRFILNKTDLDYINIKKHTENDPRYKHLPQGANCNYYFGLNVQQLEGSYQYFDLKAFKSKNKKNGINYKIIQLNFDFFNEEKIKKWLNNNFIISLNLEASELPTNSLFNNYCKYYNLEIPFTPTNIRLFGKVFASYLRKNQPFMIRSRKPIKTNNGQWTSQWYYKYIQLK